MGHDPCCSQLPTKSRNYFLACYASSLVDGDTILGGSIRARTLKHYITDAKLLFEALKLPTAGPDHLDYVKMIIQTVEAYQKVPNRRNMITDSMIAWLLTQQKTEAEDSLTAAIIDWIILGRYTGFRRSEWCQTSATKFARKEDVPGRPPEAIILGDLVYLDKDERVLDPTNKRFCASVVEYVQITWRWQKNNDNGEKITYARDRALPSLCPVLAALRITARAHRLKLPPQTPAAIYCDEKGKRKFITDSNTNKLLREAASQALGIKKTNRNLWSWSTHSIRVTAANLLHRKKFSDSFIQKRLRWKSTTFLMYLRNTIYNAKQHTLTFDLSDSNLPPPQLRDLRENEPIEDFLDIAAAAA